MRPHEPSALEQMRRRDLVADRRSRRRRGRAGSSGRAEQRGETGAIASGVLVGMVASHLVALAFVAFLLGLDLALWAYDRWLSR